MHPERTHSTDRTVLDDDALQRIADEARLHVVSTVAASKAGHVGGPLSAMDLLTALFFRHMNIDPQRPDWPERDRFILSKGHSAIGLYTVMALRGYLPVDELATFDKGNSRLQGHPDPTKLPGIETATGSLGQGLAVGVGFALGARMDGRQSRHWVMLGDGELQEGMIWESAHAAARYELGHLIAIVDQNGLQQYGWPSDGRGRADRQDPWVGFDVGAIFASFGWNVLHCDGHDYADIDRVLRGAGERAAVAAPTVIVARTVKGRGLSFAEGQHKWHTGVATAEQLTLARTELTTATRGRTDAVDA
ncbi:transketolase [Microbacterium sp. NPDC078428]|uniref:transketolase n=1 Tax=Microbacterium sp. NPDC078428 TaxID=3364190 RepID=UPI0037C82DAB